MIAGILKEIKVEENRVSMTPAGVEVLKDHGHTLLVEKGAGSGSGFEDKAYIAAGAEIVRTAKEIYDRSDLVMHVKEPMPSEYKWIRKDQIVFTYFHLAANEALTMAMIANKSIAIAYETIQKADGSLPLLIPMSEVAGRMAIQEAAKYLEMEYGGEGVLLGGGPGVEPATVLVIGAGTVGTHAAKMACGDLKVSLLKPCGQPPLKPEPQPDIFALYEQNIGLVTPMIADQLREAEKSYPENWLREAFREAVNNNRRKWSYVSAILERWAAEGRTDGTHQRHIEASPDKYIGQKYDHMVRR